VPSHDTNPPPSLIEARTAIALMKASNAIDHALSVFIVPQTNQPVFPLWPNGAPGALGTSSNDIPTLTVYLPANATSPCPAMVICPGGGYSGLADHEGGLYAQWFNQLGIAGFVLKYRLASAGYHHPAMLQDATRALRTVRARAGEWNLDPQRIGIIGSSAGGHLASTLLTHYDAGNAASPDPIERASSRPDLGILCYAVITMGKDSDPGTRTHLLGTNPPPDLVAELSNEQHVTRDTPPCFVWSTGDDKVVPVENSLAFVSALRRAGVPYDFHVYQHGPHGLGLGVHGSLDPGKLLPWTHDCEYWLKVQGWVK
jgi:acetyl esterase/lipase